MFRGPLFDLCTYIHNIVEAIEVLLFEILDYQCVLEVRDLLFTYTFLPQRVKYQCCYTKDPRLSHESVKPTVSHTFMNIRPGRSL